MVSFNPPLKAYRIKVAHEEAEKLSVIAMFQEMNPTYAGFETMYYVVIDEHGKQEIYHHTSIVIETEVSYDALQEYRNVHND